jgi:hypothetical protein
LVSKNDDEDQMVGPKDEGISLLTIPVQPLGSKSGSNMDIVALNRGGF